MLFSFHRVRLAPRLGALAVIAVVCAGASWFGWSSWRDLHAPCNMTPLLVHVTAGEVRPSETDCVLIESVSQRSATMFADADHKVHLRFGADEFVGDGTAESVNMRFEKKFEWGDGCTWKTTQEIGGMFAKGYLQFRYYERPLPGQQGCLPACTGAGRLAIE